ncbi:MAG: hypothetical protein ACTS6P_00410 [Candidatus Hodgkinia cicadicola]
MFLSFTLPGGESVDLIIHNRRRFRTSAAFANLLTRRKANRNLTAPLVNLTSWWNAIHSSLHFLGRTDVGSVKRSAMLWTQAALTSLS